MALIMPWQKSEAGKGQPKVASPTTSVVDVIGSIYMPEGMRVSGWVFDRYKRAGQGQIRSFLPAVRSQSREKPTGGDPGFWKCLLELAAGGWFGFSTGYGFGRIVTSPLSVGVGRSAGAAFLGYATAGVLPLMNQTTRFGIGATVGALVGLGLSIGGTLRDLEEPAKKVASWWDRQMEVRDWAVDKLSDYYGMFMLDPALFDPSRGMGPAVRSRQGWRGVWNSFTYEMGQALPPLMGGF